MRLLQSRSIIALLGATVSLTFLLNAMPQIAFAGQADRGGFPGRRVGGGSRSDCFTKVPLVALSPKANLGQTAAAYPTLYFLAPSATKALQLKFILKDEAGKTLAKREFMMEQAAGMMGIDLSSISQTPLALNQNYRWYLSVACSQEQSQTLIVDGWIQRIEPGTQTIPVEKSPEFIRQAWKAGLWYDAIAALIQLRRSQPVNQQATALWQEMLQSEELTQVVADPSLNLVVLRQ
ncbi:MAG: DUF928 domain-containing protein [Lyngbya sp. HA4199-MV5]|jgi:hypothetical protein|nr:DUF928 domain-containing protein [Lyngbya sp. HA4199-MV5]